MAKSTSIARYPKNHNRLSAATPIRGSMTNGYATSAERLPALLAAYRIYGSRDEFAVVRENQFRTSGAEDETTKKEIAVDTARSESSRRSWCNDNDVVETVRNVIGRNAI